MSNPRIEQEVIISFNAIDKEVSLYTSYIPMIRKLDKLCVEFPGIYNQITETKSSVDGNITSKTYMFPKNFVNVRRPKSLTIEKQIYYTEMMKDSLECYFGIKNNPLIDISNEEDNSFEDLLNEMKEGKKYA